MNPSMGLGWGILPQTLPRGKVKKRALAGADWCNMRASVLSGKPQETEMQ